MKYDLVIFDLDGTILDTLEDLTEAANRVLREAGFPAHDKAEIRRFIGNGAANMIRLAVPDGTPQSVRERLLARFREYYMAHVNVTTRPYAGIPALMRALREAGAHIAVNSNKPDAAVKALCAAHFGDLVELCAGETPDVPRKPAPDAALRIMRAFGAQPEKTLYVGDGDTDMLTAGNAGIDGAWVKWGYRDEEDLRGLAYIGAFESPLEMQRFLLS